MQLTSPAFQDGSTLPIDHTCKGRAVSPPLAISGIPPGAKSLAIIMHDPDAVGGKDFLHWSLWNISPDTAEIAENSLPLGAAQGTNDYPSVTYGPACPPAGSGLHRYVFDLYALDTTLGLANGAGREELEIAMKEHVLAAARLTGIMQT